MRTSTVVGLLSFLVIGCQEYSLQGEEKPPKDDEETVVEPPEETVPENNDPAPDILVDPLEVDFGYLPKDCTSKVERITVANEGELDLEVESIALVDNDVGAFRIALNAAQTLAPDASMEFLVDFTALDWLEYRETFVRIQSNDPDEATVDVPLIGIGAEDGIHTDLFTQNETNPVDVLFILDNSGSMSGEVDNLANTFDVFINAFVFLGLDYQIGVVTTDMFNSDQSGKLQGSERIITNATADPVAAFLEATDQGSSGSGDERGLDAGYAALTDPLISGFNAGMVRDDTVLSLIVVTDEDDGSDMDSDDFADWLDGYQGDPSLTSFSAVSGPKGGLFPCIALFSGIDAEPAPKYWDAVSQTGGMHISICTMDMSAILAALAVVAAGMDTVFDLTYTVSDPYGIVVEVDGEVIPWGTTNGWDYDAATNSIVFYGSATPLPGATVEVTYPMVTECPE